MTVSPPGPGPVARAREACAVSRGVEVHTIARPKNIPIPSRQAVLFYIGGSRKGGRQYFVRIFVNLRRYRNNDYH